jgi:hypothetical protein
MNAATYARIALAALCCPLALAAPAAAESPWVLWSQVQIGAAEDWAQVEPHESKRACEIHRDEAWKAMTATGGLVDSTGAPVSRAQALALANVAMSSREWTTLSPVGGPVAGPGPSGMFFIRHVLKCWPAGTNPRQGGR